MITFGDLYTNSAHFRMLCKLNKYISPICVRLTSI